MIFCLCLSDILRLYDLLVLYPVIGSVPKILRQDQEMKLVHHQMWLCTQSMAAWYLNESRRILTTHIELATLQFSLMRKFIIFHLDYY